MTKPIGRIIPFPNDIVIIVDSNIDSPTLIDIRELYILRINPNIFAKLSYQKRVSILIHEARHAWIWSKFLNYPQIKLVDNRFRNLSSEELYALILDNKN